MHGPCTVLDNNRPIAESLAVTNEFSWNSRVYENIAMVQRIAGIELLERLEVLGPNRATHDALAGVGSVLDIGCGTGVLAVYLAKRLPAGSVLGVDVSPTMVARARELAVSEGVKNLTIQELDVSLMEFSEGFDLVISNAAFHWILDARNLLERVYRGMRPGAELAVQFPLLNEEHPMVATMTRAIASAGLQARFQSWEFPWFRTTPEEYRRLLESKGFEVSQVEQTNDEFSLSKEEFLLFFNAVGLPLYFKGLNDTETEHLRLACHEEADALLARSGNRVLFVRLFALARKPETGR